MGAVPRKARRGHQIPWGLIGYCEPPDLGAGLCPIEQVLLITESSLQPRTSGFAVWFPPDFEPSTEYIITLVYMKNR